MFELTETVLYSEIMFAYLFCNKCPGGLVGFLFCLMVGVFGFVPV